jgi:hypothetical protein
MTLFLMENGLATGWSIGCMGVGCNGEVAWSWLEATAGDATLAFGDCPYGVGNGNNLAGT